MTNKNMGQGAEGFGRQMAPLRRFTAGVLESESLVPVVLEFEQPPVALYKRMNPQADVKDYEASLARAHKEFLEKLSSLGLEVKMGESTALVAGTGGAATVKMPHDFTHVFNGLGVLMPGRMVAQVAAMAGIRAVTLNQERVYLNLEKSVPFSGAPKVWERQDGAGRSLRGDDMIVAVIDTGLDWTHPAFGGFAEAPNEKVVHAASLTGEHPLDNFGHGTHVSCIIAGNADYKGTPRGDSLMNGVAPKAKLMSYKVLTAAGSGSATNIILAMEDAVQRGAHVMNLSLGDSYGDPFSPESSAANNAMLAGVVVCIAAGNAGPETSSVGAPGAAHHVITVGASTDDGVTALMAQLSQADQEAKLVEMRLMEGSIPLAAPAVDLEFVHCAMGQQASDFPAAVRGKIALIQRGEITFREKALGAQQAGAIAAVIYNNRDGSFFGSLGDEEQPLAIPVVSISKADGELMLQANAAPAESARPTLRLSPEEVPQPDKLAEFSSRGPNNDNWIKPELTAPGVNINSATITEAAFPGGGMPDPSGYVSASGTSMATPHVAGAAALIRQAHPEWTSLQIKAALVNTARWMPEQGDVMAQGNGAMDLERALDCRAILVTATETVGPTHSFGQVGHDGKVHTVTQALTIHTLVPEAEPSSYTLAVEIVGQPEGLNATLSAGSITCDANACVASFDLSVTADGAVLADGAYYGFVTATAEWGTLRLPFYYEAARTPSVQPVEPSAQGRTAPPQERKRFGKLPCC